MICTNLLSIREASSLLKKGKPLKLRPANGCLPRGHSAKNLHERFFLDFGGDSAAHSPIRSLGTAAETNRNALDFKARDNACRRPLERNEIPVNPPPN